MFFLLSFTLAFTSCGGVRPSLGRLVPSVGKYRGSLSGGVAAGAAPPPQRSPNRPVPRAHCRPRRGGRGHGRGHLRRRYPPLPSTWVHLLGGQTGPGWRDVSQCWGGCSGVLMDPRPPRSPPALPDAPLARAAAQGGSAGPLSWACPPGRACPEARPPAALSCLRSWKAMGSGSGAGVGVIPPCLSPPPPNLGGEGSRAGHSPRPKHVPANPSFAPP